MNRLHLLRHAKASAKEGMDDRDRPLSRRGRETARRLGEHIPAKLGRIDLVLCSSSRRTRETLDLILSGFSPRPRISIEDGLYLASRQELAARLRRLRANDRNVLVICHNPGLHELAVALADKKSPDFQKLASGKFPTAAFASFRVPEWPTLSDAPQELTAYRTSKSLSGEKE